MPCENASVCISVHQLEGEIVSINTGIDTDLNGKSKKKMLRPIVCCFEDASLCISWKVKLIETN